VEEEEEEEMGGGRKGRKGVSYATSGWRFSLNF
jgi:hypothetical protein